MKKYDYCVTVGRFQVPDLHYAHIKILYDMMVAHKKVLVLVGSSQAPGTDIDPLDYPSRKAMIEKQFPNIIVDKLTDHRSDDIWSDNLDKKIRQHFPKGTVVVSGGRDSFLNHYKGKFPTREFKKINHWPGTAIREKVGKTVKDSSEWREGQIYLTQNQFPRTFMTVDVAIIKKENGIMRVLLGKKEGCQELRFVGGFVDPTDNGLIEACKREVQEETDLEVDDFQFVSSIRVNDSRYAKSKDGIMTSFFVGKYLWGSHFKAKDDIVHLDWYCINKSLVKKMTPGHGVLLEDLIKYTDLLSDEESLGFEKLKAEFENQIKDLKMNLQRN